MKSKLLILTMLFVLLLAGCPNSADTTDNTTANSSNNNTSTKISGLQANIAMEGYINNQCYSIQLDASKATFIATPISGRGDDTTASTLTGSFVCNKTETGDDLFWYAHNSAICLKPDTATDSTGTDKNCYKIIADLTNTDATSKVTVNQYHTSTMTSADYTAAENSVKTTWDHSNDATTVTFTEKQKECLTKANTELAKCTKKEVSSLTQTFDVDGNTTKDYTVGFSFNLGDTTCDVYIDKDNVKISTDQSSDFSRTTPTWLMDAVKTVIKTGASPDDIKNCTELKNCTALQTVITELASAVGTSNDDVVYTESGKEGYQEIPCPWSEDELAKMKAFTDHYKDEVGEIVRPNTYVAKFSNDDAFAENADGDRTNNELIFIMGYGYITEMIDDHRFNFGNEHVFGIKVTVDLEGFNALQLNEWTNPSIIYDYFTFSKADAVTNSAEPLTWYKTTDPETNRDSYEPIYDYEETPQWILDMITTYTSKDHSDYDRQFNIGGTSCPLSYIGDIWIDEICYEYLYGPNYNTGYNDRKFMFEVYEKDLSTDTYPTSATRTMEIKEIKALVSAGDYEAYTSAVETTEMSNLWNDYELASKDSDGHTITDDVKVTSYTRTFYGQSPIYVKKKLSNIYILQWRGTNCRYLAKNNDPDYKWTISELQEYMDEHAIMQGFKVYTFKGTASEINADEIYQDVYDREILSFEENGMIRVFDNSSGMEMSFSTNDYYICPYNDPNPID